MKAVYIALGLLLVCTIAFAIDEVKKPLSSPDSTNADNPAECSKPSSSVSKIGDTWTNSLGMKFAYIPAGEFDMGSPAGEAGHLDNETLHHVKLTKATLMATTHVTRAQFAQFIEETRYKTDADKDGSAVAWNGKDFDRVTGASWRNAGFVQGDEHPAVEVSWNDANAYCAWLSKKEHRKYRLPTEAEWEYACRAGTKTAYPWGDNPDDGKGWANCADEALKAKFPSNTDVFIWNDGYVFTSPVGKFKPNAWGLYDMVGDAWEWCSDAFAAHLSDATDPTGPPQGDTRVARGGSWHDSPSSCRSAFRLAVAPYSRDFSTGLRLVLELE